MNIEKFKDLSNLNTFGVRIIADYYAAVTSEEELEEALNFASFKNVSCQILGGGSNTLFVNNYRGMIIHIVNKGIRWNKDSNDIKQKVEVSAGEDWHSFVQSCLKRNLYGLENLALIPGTVGGSPIQNIGAYGVEVKDFIMSVRVFDQVKKNWVMFSNEDCGFSYRDSVFKNSNRYIVFSVLFNLNRRWKPNLDHEELFKRFSNNKVKVGDVFDEVCNLRSSKLPDTKEQGNAGSFFKNPIISKDDFNDLNSKFPDMPAYNIDEKGEVKIPAAWLLDELGWRGKRVGDAAVSHKHALIIINNGNATGKDIMNLAGEMSATVYDRYGISLKPEVKIIDS